MSFLQHGVHGYTVTEEKRSCVVNHVMIISIFSCPSTLRITNSTMSPGALEYSMSNCRSLMKVKFPTDQFRLALGSCHCLMDCHHAQKPQNCPISDFFDLTPKYFLVFLHYTDLVPPSTDPVPPLVVHQVPTSTAPYIKLTQKLTKHCKTCGFTI